MNSKIKCINSDCLDICTCYVYIFNHKNKLIYKGITDKFGILNYNFPTYGIYKIVVISKIYPYKLCQSVLINSNNCTVVPFVFSCKIKINHHNVTFLLVDKNYENLPISKGEINLCKIK